MKKSMKTRSKPVNITNVWQSECNDEHSKCSENVRQYFLNTSLHGLKYVGLSNITHFERGFFLLSFFLVFLLSIYFISNVYEKWSSSPVIITFSSATTSISDLPFPAVTICNMNKARLSVVDSFKNGSLEESLLRNFCLENYPEETIKDTDKSGQWDVLKHFLINISQPCSDMLIDCQFGMEIFQCLEIFDAVLTDEGLCCIFNTVHSRFLYKNDNSTNEFDVDSNSKIATPVDWTPEIGFSAAGGNKKVSPRPAPGAGSHIGLNIILNAAAHDYYCSSTNSIGFKVLLHNPTETPLIADYGVFVMAGHETRIIIKPRISTSSRLVRNIDQKRRRCIFPNEANLTYFRTYSRKNCIMECQSRIIAELCGCIIYYLPKISEGIRICSRSDFNCYNRVKTAIERGESDTYQCVCLPACYELNFAAELSSAPLVSENIYSDQEILKHFPNDQFRKSLASLQIFYTENNFRSFIKEELIGFTDFLSDTGGLLGLFMGFSVLSLIELIYFITLRPYCRHCKRQRINRLQKKTTNLKSSFLQNNRFESSPSENTSVIQHIRTNTKNVKQKMIHFDRGFHANANSYPYID